MSQSAEDVKVEESEVECLLRHVEELSKALPAEAGDQCFARQYLVSVLEHVKDLDPATDRYTQPRDWRRVQELWDMIMPKDRPYPADLLACRNAAEARRGNKQSV